MGTNPRRASAASAAAAIFASSSANRSGGGGGKTTSPPKSKAHQGGGPPGAKRVASKSAATAGASGAADTSPRTARRSENDDEDPVSPQRPPRPSPLALLRSPIHRAKILHSAMTAAGICAAVALIWFILVLSWTWTGNIGPNINGGGDDDESILRRIHGLEQRNHELQKQLDEYDVVLGQIAERRIELQPLRERYANLVNRVEARRLLVAETDQEKGDDEEEAPVTASFPRLDELVAHLRRRQQQNQDVDGGNEDHDDDNTAHVRDLFFQARNELYRHSQQFHQDEASPSTTLSLPPNYTIVNSLLQSYGSDWDWRVVLPTPQNCPVEDGTASSAGWTSEAIEQWVASNKEVQDRVAYVQEILNDRVAVDDREWKVALEDTYDRVQKRYMELAFQSNTMIFQQMKELQQHLDHWEVRVAQKGASVTTTEASAIPEMNNQCAQPSQVLHWIDVALDAHYRNRSVREAILTALTIDPNVDPNQADLASSQLPPDSTVDLSSRPRGRRRSLRLMLDTPLLHQSGVWIDQLLEYVEGRNDKVDAWIDALAVQASIMAAAEREELPDVGSDDSSASSIGRYVVRSLLAGVGRVVDDTIQPWLDGKPSAPTPSNDKRKDAAGGS